MKLLSTFLVLSFPIFASAQANLKSPNVSANSLFLYRNSNFSKEDNSTVRNGFDLQEAELAFYADVDPYSRLVMLLTVHPEYTVDSSNKTVSQSWAVEPEELYAEINHFQSVTIKLGKFKSSFGKHNILHAHVYPFVDAPLANATLLRDDGLSDVGISAAILLPSSWFNEITLQYIRGEDKNIEFNSATPGDGVGIGRWKNLFDLSDEMTMEFGGSGAYGNNSLRGVTRLGGVDLTFKWRPLKGGKYNSWTLASEYINRVVEQPNSSDERGHGLAIWGQYQFAERWSVLVRNDVLNVVGSNPTANPNSLPNATTTKNSLSLVFNATEFSSYRLEHDWLTGPPQPNGETDEKKIYFQANFTIGAHPAHSY